MKLLLPLVGLALAVSAPSTLAQGIPGSVASVNFNFTFSFSIEGTVMKDETTGKPITGKDEFGDPLGGPTFSNMWTITKTDKEENILSEEYHSEFVSKIATTKYSNKEFLLDLVASGNIPEIGNEPFIAGWTIVEVVATVDDGLEGMTGPGVMYAVHAGEGLAILLTGVVIDRDYEARSGYAENSNYKSVSKNDYVKETETSSRTDSRSWKSVRRYVMDFNGTLEQGDFSESSYQFQGIYTNTEKLTKVRTGDPEFPEVPVYQCGPSKLDKISGTGPYYGEEQIDREVIEGTLSTAAGKVYPDISEQFPEAAEAFF